MGNISLSPEQSFLHIRLFRISKNFNVCLRISSKKLNTVTWIRLHTFQSQRLGLSRSPVSRDSFIIWYVQSTTKLFYKSRACLRLGYSNHCTAKRDTLASRIWSFQRNRALSLRNLFSASSMPSVVWNFGLWTL